MLAEPSSLVFDALVQTEETAPAVLTGRNAGMTGQSLFSQKRTLSRSPVVWRMAFKQGFNTLVFKYILPFIQKHKYCSIGQG